MDTLPASSLDLRDAAGLGGADHTRDRGAAERGGRVTAVLRFVRRNLFWGVVVILVACLVGGLAYLQTWPPLAIVQSGSMVPAIQIGDVEVLKHLDGPPRVGDIIVVHVPDAARSRYGYPPVVTHRVVRISHGMVTTKGDALKVVDPFTTPVNTVTEQVVAVIPDAGRIYGFFTSTWGMLWIAIGALMLVGLPLLDRRHERDEQERGTLASLQSQLEALTNELSGRSDRSASALSAAGEHAEPIATGTPTPATEAATAVQTPVEPRAADAPAQAPTLPWSWAIVAAAATVAGCHLRDRRRESSSSPRSPSPSWAWPSSRPAPAPAPPLKPLTEVLSTEAINRINSSETIARLGSRYRRPDSKSVPSA